MGMSTATMSADRLRSLQETGTLGADEESLLVFRVGVVLSDGNKATTTTMEQEG